MISVLQRFIDPQTHSSARTDFLIRPEGKAYLDSDVKLEAAITVTGTTTGFENDFSRRAGAFSMLDAIEIRAENGTQMFRLDRASMYAAFAKLREDPARVMEVEDLLNSSKVSTMINDDGTVSWLRMGYRKDPFTADANTTRKVILDLRRVVSMFRSVFPLADSGELRLSILWTANSNVWDGSTFTAYAVNRPRLSYQLVNIPKYSPPKGPMSFLEPVLAVQRIPASTAGQTQRAVVPLGFNQETVGRLLLANLGEDDSVTVQHPVTTGLTADGDSASGQPIVEVTEVVSTDWVGLRVTGTGIAADSVISAVSVANRTLTLDKNLTAICPNGSVVTVITLGPLNGNGFIVTSTAAVAVAADVLTVDDVTNCYEGSSIKGTGIPADTTISSVNIAAKTIKISNALAVYSVSVGDQFIVGDPGIAIVNRNRSDRLQDLALNLRVNAAQEFPSPIGVGECLGLLEESFGTLDFPMSAYGNGSTNVCADAGIFATCSYLGFDIDRKCSEDIELDLQRTGVVGRAGSALDVYAYAECVRAFNISGGNVIRVV